MVLLSFVTLRQLTRSLASRAMLTGKHENQQKQ
jgi:hypothetical protein